MSYEEEDTCHMRRRIQAYCDVTVTQVNTLSADF
jgi:hypothetical protein